MAAEQPGAAAVEIPLTQDDLASFAGATRATANRALRALATAEVISLARGRITVVDHERLLLAARCAGVPQRPWSHWSR